jgi:hypothetical protein
MNPLRVRERIIYRPSHPGIEIGLDPVALGCRENSSAATGELLRTDSTKGPWQYGRMTKKKRASKRPETAILAAIKREMQEPRLTKSSRGDRRGVHQYSVRTRYSGVYVKSGERSVTSICHLNLVMVNSAAAEPHIPSAI